MVNKEKNKNSNFILMIIAIIGIMIIGVLILYIYNDNYVFYINEKSIEIETSEIYSIELAAKNPNYLDNDSYIFKSSDENIATVDKFGNITAKKEGKVEITIKAKKGFHKEKITLVIKDRNLQEEITKIWFSSNTYALKINNSLTLKLISEKENLDTNKITWASSNENIATVDPNGVVTGKNNGETIITATYDNGLKATCKIIVQSEEIVPTSISLNKTAINIYLNDKFTLTANVLPENSTNKNIDWSSSNSNVVEVKNGILTAKNIGTATITATLVNGIKANCIVTVEEIKPNSILLNRTNVTMTIGGEETLITDIKPNNATNKNISWTSSDETIASVNNGKITAKKEGTVTITAETSNGLKAICNVTVQKEEIKATSISLSKNNTTIYIGKNEILKTNILPTNATNQKVTWKSSNTEIATVENGIVTAKKEGTVTITATLSNGLKATCTIKVEKETINPTMISLNKTTTSIYIGNEETLTATILPTNSTNKTITWTSSDNTIATVNNGKITAKSEGTVTITAKTSNGLKATCKVVVSKKEIQPTDLTLNKTTITLYPSDTYTITATVHPTNATNQNIVWSSSNTTVATVNNGKITAKSEGTATITAKINNTNIKKTVNLQVTKKKISVTGITLNKTSETVYTNSSNKIVNLTATVYPTTADNKNISWKSSNTSVAVVENGKVTAKNPGVATITVTTEDGGFAASYKITVKKKAIVVVTASQGVRMDKWFESYISKNGNYYSKTDKTLKYVYLSGSGFEFQYGDGLTQAINYINEQFSSYKKYIDLNIYFTMTGNSVKKFTCNEIQTSDEYINIAQKYNESIQKIKDLGYTNVQGHVISHSPLNTKHPLAKENKIVYSHYEEACKSGYRSAWKYYLSNNRAKPIINSNTYPNIKFVDNWSNFLIIQDEANRKFTWLQTFTTPDDDPLHWDEATTKLYMQMAFDTANM